MDDLNRLVLVLVGGLGMQAVYAGALLVGVGAFELVARGRWARLRYALWALVVVRLLLPPRLASPASLRGLLDIVGAMPSPARGPAGPAAGALGARIAAGGSAPALWVVVVAAVWLAGAAATLALVVSWRRHTRRLVAGARPVRSRRCLAAAERWRTRLGIRRPVRLLASPACRSPFTVGALRPVVVLPEAMAEAWPDELLEPVLVHELVHVARWDDLVVRAVNLAQVLFFFHPAAWLAARRLATLREELCDAAAVSRGELGPREYCRSLVEQVRWQVFGTRPDAALSLADTGDAMKRRVTRLLGGLATEERGGWRVWAAAGALALVLLPMAPTRPAPAVGDQPSHAGAAAATRGVSDAGVRPAAGAVPIQFSPGGGLTEPRRIAGPRPGYTEEARAAGISGVVILRAVINDEGRVDGVTVLRGLPHGLTEAAAAALWQWRFQPATRDGVPVPVIYVLTIRFDLDSTAPSDENLGGGV